MISLDQVTESIGYHLRTVLPNQILVIAGESYGVNLMNPSGVRPSISFTLEEARTYGLELGSVGMQYDVSYTINAQSRKQRDAMKTLLFSGLLNNVIQIYTAFSGGAPVGGVRGVADIYDHISVRDMPNLSDDRERFFWIATAYNRLILQE